MIDNILTFRGINIYKTIVYNFKYFDFKTAIKLPIFVYGRVRILGTKGNISLPQNVRRGMIRIGILLTHLIDSDSQTVIQAGGQCLFNGSCCIGRGSKICISKGGRLSFGTKFNSSGRLNICCEKEISISDDCMFSWDVTLIDSDFHPIIDLDGNVINPSRKISIGNHVWIGFNCQILKGVTIPDNNIVAAGSVVRKSMEMSDAIYAPQIIMVKKIEGVKWTKDYIEEYDNGRQNYLD